MAEDYGIKYAVTQKSLEDRDPHSVGYSSTDVTLKKLTSGVVSISTPNTTLTTLEIPHGLGYRPAFNAYFRDPLNGEVYPVSSGFESVDFNRLGSVANVHAKSNNYNLVLQAYQNSGSTKGIDIFYEIFYEDLVTEPIFYFR